MDRIESVDVFILKAPLGKAKFWSSQSSFPERNSLLGKVPCSLLTPLTFLASEDHQWRPEWLGGGGPVRTSRACGLCHPGEIRF